MTEHPGPVSLYSRSRNTWLFDLLEGKFIISINLKQFESKLNYEDVSDNNLRIYFDMTSAFYLKIRPPLFVYTLLVKNIL
jgi:hypothetical protein